MTPPKAATKSSTDDLTEEVGESGPDRRQRRRERAGEKQKRLTEERLDQARRMAEELRHKRDCPEEGAMPDDGERRVEFFPSTRPATERESPQGMLVIRCVECGESEVAIDESEA